jgi:hypothetical protein
VQKRGNNTSLIARLLEGGAHDIDTIKEVAATTYTGRQMVSDY